MKTFFSIFKKNKKFKNFFEKFFFKKKNFFFRYDPLKPFPPPLLTTVYRAGNLTVFIFVFIYLSYLFSFYFLIKNRISCLIKIQY